MFMVMRGSYGKRFFESHLKSCLMAAIVCLLASVRKLSYSVRTMSQDQLIILKNKETNEVYYTRKNKRKVERKIELKKYSKKLRKRVIFKEAKK